MVRVITYQAPNGETVNLTPGQIRDLEQAGAWPRNASGEFCTVSHGLHEGVPSYTSADIARLVLSSLDTLAAAMRAHASWTLDEHGQWSSNLPTFGGEPVNEPGVWSWDRDRLLVGSSAEDLAIIPRVTVDLVNPWTGARVERDVSLLTEEQLQGLAQVFDDDVMEIVNDHTSADTTPGQWLAGYVARVGPERAGVQIIGS